MPLAMSSHLRFIAIEACFTCPIQFTWIISSYIDEVYVTIKVDGTDEGHAQSLVLLVQAHTIRPSCTRSDER